MPFYLKLESKSMCGISGIVNLDGAAVDADALARMNSLIEHRGPDADGSYIEGAIGLAHRRLAILDLRPEGDQPLWRGDSLAIVFNGEIYNYLELRLELEESGYAFNTNGDTEVILAAYQCWGEDCVSHFNGMWAFALLDREKKRLFCSRDRFGVKPFYYTLSRDGNELRFGSEIRQLVSDAPDVNKPIVIDYLLSAMADHSADTFFTGISKLPQSHNLIIDYRENTFKLSRYYDLPPDTVNQLANNEGVDSDAQVYGEFKAELSRAVRYRLRSDVVVGSCLSGGLDSSSVVALAAQQLAIEKSEGIDDDGSGSATDSGKQSRLTAITSVVAEAELDESIYASQVAQLSGANWVTVEPTSEDFSNTFEEVIRLQEEPFTSPSVYMQFFVLKKAQEIGCKVMLDGQGGDETLLGYTKYFPAAFYSEFRSRGVRHGCREVLDALRNNKFLSIKQLFLFSAGTFFSRLRKLYLINSCRFLRKEWRQYLDLSFLDRISQSGKSLYETQKLEIQETNLPLLLRYEDKNSMWHSIETRLPFLDYQLVQKCMSLEANYKICLLYTSDAADE